ncbi:peptidase C13 family protein [Dictyocaulus viviparus]|uniref:legumain n=1 Tax=Dictyocaulus viviparus TaxID=29172 RepID=A0A0D8XXE0_DICVI|nr:peptidase C13 family protein [Dictyocaulus viviparus]
MIAFLWIFVTTVLITGKSVLALNLHDFLTPKAEPAGELHALLVAGSNGWWNYRHQADVAHAYHLLLSKGILPEHIIVMMYDDIANDPSNPFRGKLFNRPNGTDVYKGLKIDYSGSSVNPKNFLNVLEGNSEAVKGGNGRVINSKATDRIFVYFSDHGGEGLICFPDDVLTKKDLNSALQRMHKSKKYDEFVFYLEACESGSMFKKTLEPSMNIYAVTASNPVESSWATYCDYMDLPCLGDEFSVNWMEDSEKHDIDAEQLDAQFEDVKKMTKLSHVMHYGNLKIAKESVGWFQGEHGKKLSVQTQYEDDYPKVSWDARDVELMYMKKLQKTTTISLHAQALEQRDRRDIEALFMSLVDNLLPNTNDKKEIFDKRNDVEDLSCHDDVVKAFDTICIDVNRFDYALKYIYVLNNLCVKFGDSKKIINAMHATCSTATKQFL